METVILDFGRSTIKAATKLDASGVAAEHMQEPLLLISADMMRAEEALFRSQGRRGGGSWKQLSENTVRRKGHSIILTDTGALRRSLTEPGAPYQILQISNDGLVFGTERPLADVHQYGSRDGHTPPRPFLRFTPVDADKWKQLLMQHVLKVFHA